MLCNKMARTNEDDNRDDDDDVEPFTNELQYTLIEKIQLGVLGVVLVPVRTALAAGKREKHWLKHYRYQGKMSSLLLLRKVRSECLHNCLHLFFLAWM